MSTKVIGSQRNYTGHEHGPAMYGVLVRIVAVMRDGPDGSILRADADAGAVRAADRIEVQPYDSVKMRWCSVTIDADPLDLGFGPEGSDEGGEA